MAKDPRQMPDEAELLRQLKAMTPEEAADIAPPPGFEDETVESEKDKPTLHVEKVETEKIETTGTEGTQDTDGMTEDFMANVTLMLKEISDKLSSGFFLD